MTKQEIISKYKRVRETLGHQPSLSEFIKYSNVTRRSLGKAFGVNAFSKLTEECGDTPHGFSTPKSKLDDIFRQYGELTRKLRRLPASIEWDNEKLKPTVCGIGKSHKFRWGEMPNKFLQFAAGKTEWDDVVTLIPADNHIEEHISVSSSAACFVYLMLDTKTRLYKIGISKTAEYREKTLQSAQPSIKLIAKMKCPNRRMAATIEKSLHETYSHKKKRGEWFLLNDGEVNEITATLNRTESDTTG